MRETKERFEQILCFYKGEEKLSPVHEKLKTALNTSPLREKIVEGFMRQATNEIDPKIYFSPICFFLDQEPETRPGIKGPYTVFTAIFKNNYGAFVAQSKGNIGTAILDLLKQMQAEDGLYPDVDWDAKYSSKLICDAFMVLQKTT